LYLITRVKAIAYRISGIMCWLALALAQGAEKSAGTIEKGEFRLSYDERGITGLANPRDPFGAEMIPLGQRLGLTVKFKSDDGWKDIATYAESSANEARVTYTNAGTTSSLKAARGITTEKLILALAGHFAWPRRC
jgi:hypothetical protein